MELTRYMWKYMLERSQRGTMQQELETKNSIEKIERKLKHKIWFWW